MVPIEINNNIKKEESALNNFFKTQHLDMEKTNILWQLDGSDLFNNLKKKEKVVCLF